MPRKQHTATNTLLWRPCHPDDSDNNNKDIDDWILVELGVYNICPIEAEDTNKESGEEDPKL